MFQHRISSLLVLVSLSAVFLGCSSGSPVSPSMSYIDNLQTAVSPGTNDGHWSWGYWDLWVDLENGTVRAEPMRSAQLHFNVVPLLKEGSPGSLLGISNLMVDGSNHTVQVDISLTHPYPTLAQVPGFDVRGILFSLGGSIDLLGGSIRVAGPDEPRLINADGYTRWWNPTEFPGPGILGYQDGKLGSPHWSTGYTINLAGYKYFADGLNATESMNGLNVNDRGAFRPGSTNTRRYLIDFGDTGSHFLKFNYAVDACWGKVLDWNPGDPNPVVPDSFELTANCPEPYRLRITESINTLSATTAGGTGGTIGLNIDVYDWQAMSPLSTVPMEVSTVQVEVPAFAIGPTNATVVPGSGAGGHMSTYQINIVGSTGEKLDYLDIFVSANMNGMDYQNDLTNFMGVDPLQTYFLHTAAAQDLDVYLSWTHRYTRLLYNEYPNQGDNPPDIAVYMQGGIARGVMVDQINPDTTGSGNHHPDSINEWADDYTSHSVPEQYHLPLGDLSVSGRWDDIDGIAINDNGSQFFFTNTNIFDEFPTPGFDPLFCYLTRVKHEYLGNDEPTDWLPVFFSDDDYPRMWATDPSNGVNALTDWMYAVWLYDVTGLAGGDPGVDPLRYIIFRWAPPYDQSLASADWQRPNNISPSGSGTGYLDRSEPYDHRLAVDDGGGMTRVYMLDSVGEIEVMDCNFAQDEYSGHFYMGTVTIANHPPEIEGILDIEVIPTKDLGTTRNHVAALCRSGETNWRIWVFDYDSTLPIDLQANTVWLSEEYAGEPMSMDAADGPIELHVLHQTGDFMYMSVFRNFP